MTPQPANLDPSFLTVMLVDDDDGDAKAVTRAFRSARVSNPIVRARDGVEALEILNGTHPKTRIEPPFVLLVDINMPRMDGHEFVAALREHDDFRKHIVFMLTTSRDVDDINRAYENNVAGYIVKEDAGGDFLRLAHTLDEFWMLVQKPAPHAPS
ncbi:response regulator [Acuticoccus sp. MNP-M23]|uniref:response regulator n=1 Tax=Acuticoccus sp. MNP-M23 TaxID=3072793 RepID=UPI002815D157|nr:response regulator [Acuticoccus sp. MNP-M23]WMS42784.1 response regulator [Acuticoccus sp. MNP-M23]